MASTCAIKSDGSLWCWGEIANVIAPAAISVPQPIGNATDWQTVAAGESHGCGVRSGGALWCFGDANDGKLGDNNAWRTDPVQVVFQP